MRTVVRVEWFDDEGELRETRRHEVFERSEVAVEFYERVDDVKVDMRGPASKVAKVREAIKRGMESEPDTCNCGADEACDRCPR